MFSEIHPVFLFDVGVNMNVNDPPFIVEPKKMECSADIWLETSTKVTLTK